MRDERREFGLDILCGMALTGPGDAGCSLLLLPMTFSEEELFSNAERSKGREGGEIGEF